MNILDDLKELVEMLQSDYKIVKCVETEYYIKSLEYDISEIIKKYDTEEV